MYQHKSWTTFWSLLAVSLFFLSVYWNMRMLSQHEQNQFQGDFTAIQVQISGQITKGYEKGTEVVSSLNRRALDNTERIGFELLDQMLVGMNDEQAYRFIEAYFQNDIAAYAILDRHNFKVIEASERQPTLPTLEVLFEWTKGIQDGEAISKDAYTLILKDGIKRPRLHLYKLNAKPWLIYMQVDESNKLKTSQLTEEAIMNRFSLLNSEATSDLIYLDANQQIIKSSKQDLIGAQVTLGKQVLTTIENEGAQDFESDYIWMDLRDSSGVVNRYIGRFVGTEAEQKYFISEAKQFEKERVTVGKTLFRGAIFNILMGILVIHLVAKNYEYFIEGRHKRGGI